MSVLVAADQSESLALEVRPQSPPPLAVREGAFRRYLYVLLALLVIGGFCLVSGRFWVPLHAGIDQNGYLVGGKQIARSGTMKLAPRRVDTGELDNHQFVGGMWVGAELGTPRQRYYPKYPIGQSLLIAAALRIGGERWGTQLAYWVNPIAAAGGLWATFLLIRLWAGSFFGIMGMIVVATSPVLLLLTNNPNSHATDFFFAAWGMYLLFRWLEAGRRWRAALAGFCLGYACTIRYSEGLLVLPLLAAALLAIQWRNKKRWIEILLLAGYWLLPVGLMAIYNRVAIGHWTGYDPTNESAGFAWSYAADNWETMLRQMATNGLFFIFPLGVAGLVELFFRNWKTGLLLSLWIMPCLLIYTFYYWAPDGTNIGYLRFFLSIFPAIAACAMMLLYHLSILPSHGRWINGRRLGAISMAAVLTAIAVAVHIENSTDSLLNDYQQRLLLLNTSDAVIKYAPPGSVVFSPNAALLHQLQFAGDYYLYSEDTFNPSYITGLPRQDADDPQYFDPNRKKMLFEQYHNLNARQLLEEEVDIIGGALAAGRRVFFVLDRNRNEPLPENIRPPDARSRKWPAQVAKLLSASEANKPTTQSVTLRRLDAKVVDYWRYVVDRPAQRPNVPRRRLPARRQVLASNGQIIEMVLQPPTTRPTTAP